ncbi:MAG: putative DNA-binding domain-containing protein [Bacteroidota bacterium]
MEPFASGNLTAETIKIQESLVEYCRSNFEGEIPGIRKDRLPNYRRLIHTIYWEALSDAYPIAKSLLPSDQWDELVDDFISNHRNPEPQLYKMPKGLIEFVEHKEYARIFQVPYLVDLLSFEWFEIEVHSMKDQATVLFNPDGNFMDNQIVFNPYQRIVQLEYPIHQLKTNDISLLKGTYFYNVYRQENGTVQYMEMNAFTANLLQQLIIHCTSYSVYEILATLLFEMDINMKANITDEVHKFCALLKEKGLILGTI